MAVWPSQVDFLSILLNHFKIIYCLPQENAKPIKTESTMKLSNFNFQWTKNGSCLLWVMSTEISVDIAVDIAVDSRSIVGRQSVDSRSIVGRWSVDSRSIVGR